MKNLFKTFLGVAAALAISAGVASAQSNPYRIIILPSSEVTSVSTNVTAVNTAPILVVKYTGPTTQASTFAVTTLDYIFTVAGSADATINGCGGTAGTLDTGTAPCTTIAGLVGRIHASPNWSAVIYGALAADSTTAAGGSPAQDVTSVAGSTAAGVPVFNLSSTSLQTTVTFTPSNTTDIRDFLQSTTAGTGAASGGAFRVAPNFWVGQRTFLAYSLSNITSTAGAASSINCAKTTYNRDGSVTEVNRVLFGFTQAASATDKILDFSGSGANLFCNPGERLLARYATTVTHTAPVVRILGAIQPAR